MVSAMRRAARPFLLRAAVGRAWGASEAPAARNDARLVGSAEGAGAKAKAPPA